jgi:hypothetical protein
LEAKIEFQGALWSADYFIVVYMRVKIADLDFPKHCLVFVTPRQRLRTAMAVQRAFYATYVREQININ